MLDRYTMEASLGLATMIDIRSGRNDKRVPYRLTLIKFQVCGLTSVWLDLPLAEPPLDLPGFPLPSPGSSRFRSCIRVRWSQSLLHLPPLRSGLPFRPRAPTAKKNHVHKKTRVRSTGRNFSVVCKVFIDLKEHSRRGDFFSLVKTCQP